ncbi:hypothetical protein BH10ACT1_BH10ACT1_01770 [soil metagenome]
MHRTHRTPTTAIAVLVAAALAVALGSCSRPSAAATVAIPGGAGPGVPATVTHVVDGDTVDLAFAGGAVERGRLLGIDTPETVKPNAPIDCFGPEASARTKVLLSEGTAVLVQRDAEARDRYGRLLVYVWRRSDGLFVNASLVTDGFARTLSIAPNTSHRADLAIASAAAAEAGRGLWGACAEGDDAGGPGP